MWFRIGVKLGQPAIVLSIIIRLKIMLKKYYSIHAIEFT
jgi:hypothetical protein